MSDYDFTEQWTVDLWRKALRAAEDAAFNNARAVLQLIDELDQLAAELERRPPSKWEDANRARLDAARLRGIEARALHAQGQTVAQIMARLGKSRRTVEGYLKQDG